MTYIISISIAYCYSSLAFHILTYNMLYLSVILYYYDMIFMRIGNLPFYFNYRTFKIVVLLANKMEKDKYRKKKQFYYLS